MKTAERPDVSEPSVTAEEAARNRELADYVIKSYRYLRLSIVVILLALMAAVFIERAHVDCWQGSLSSYFYTPVHSILISALVVLAVSLIAIRGCTVFEDVALNVAGVLAAIVAFVPTAPSEHECTSTPFVGGDASAAIRNNLLALVISGFIALVGAFIGWWVLRNHRSKRTAAAPKRGSRLSTILGFVAAVVLFGVGTVWYFAFHDSFIENAHGWGAVGMFLVIGVVVTSNALTTRGSFRAVYSVTAIAMVASFGI